MVLKPPIRSLRHANADIVLGVLASEQYKRKGRITCQSKLQLAQNGPERLIMRSENFGQAGCLGIETASGGVLELVRSQVFSNKHTTARHQHTGEL